MTGRLVAVLLAAVLVVAACGGGAKGALTTAPRGFGTGCGSTTPGGQVVVYSMTGLEYWYSDVLTSFQYDCNVQVAYVGLSPTDLLARLQSEKASPLADIVVAPAVQLAAAAAQGLLVTGPVAGAGKVPANRCAADRTWCEVAETYTSWVLNNGAGGGPLPAAFEDLLAPRFAGRVLYGPPTTNDDGLAMITLLRMQMGDGPAFTYLSQLEANVAAHDASTDAMSKVVSEGLASAAGGNLQEHLNDLQQYPGLDVWFPGRVTLAMPIGAAFVARGPDAANARALLARLWGDTAQLDLGTANVAPARPDLVPSDSRSQLLEAKLQGVTVLRADWAQVVAGAAATEARWAELRHAPVTSTPTTILAPPSVTPTTR